MAADDPLHEARRSNGVVRRSFATALAILFLVGVFPPNDSAAQTTLLRPSDELRFWAEIAGADLAGASFDALEATATAAVPLRPGMTLVTGLSLVGAQAEGLSSSVVISNVYASLQLGAEGTFGTITLTLPTTGHITNQAYAADAGLLLDLKHPERFTPRTIGIEVSVTPRWQFGRDTEAGARLGVASVAPSAFRREFYGRFAGFATVDAGPVRLTGELSGATFLGGEVDGFGERTVSHTTVLARVESSPLAPGVWIRLPLDDDARGATHVVVGVRVRVR